MQFCVVIMANLISKWTSPCKAWQAWFSGSYGYKNNFKKGSPFYILIPNLLHSYVVRWTGSFFKVPFSTFYTVICRAVLICSGVTPYNNDQETTHLKKVKLDPFGFNRRIFIFRSFRRKRREYERKLKQIIEYPPIEQIDRAWPSLKRIALELSA